MDQAHDHLLVSRLLRREINEIRHDTEATVATSAVRNFLRDTFINLRALRPQKNHPEHSCAETDNAVKENSVTKKSFTPENARDSAIVKRTNCP